MVKAGDVLVKLDSDNLRTKIEESVLAVEKAWADLARRGLDIEPQRPAPASRPPRSSSLWPSLSWPWEKGDVPKNRRELDLALQKAQRLVERTKRDYEISVELHAQKFISLNDLEDSEIAELEAKDGLLSAELDISVYDQYTFQTERQQKQSDLDQAESDLEREIAKNESEIARLEADLSSKTQTLLIREESSAPSGKLGVEDGIVVYALGRLPPLGDPMAEGERSVNETILYIPNISQMVANLAIAEAYEPLVRTGQTVRVTVDARPGEVFTGTIDRTTPLTESGGWLNPGRPSSPIRRSTPSRRPASSPRWAAPARFRSAGSTTPWPCRSRRYSPKAKSTSATPRGQRPGAASIGGDRAGLGDPGRDPLGPVMGDRVVA